MLSLLHLALSAYSIVVFVHVVLSWIQLGPDHPIVRFTSALTEPALRRIRAVLPATSGIDLSPMVLLIGLYILRRVLFSL